MKVNLRPGNAEIFLAKKEVQALVKGTVVAVVGTSPFGRVVLRCPSYQKKPMKASV